MRRLRSVGCLVTIFGQRGFVKNGERQQQRGKVFKSAWEWKNRFILNVVVVEINLGVF